MSNNQKTNSRHINGVKTYYKAGAWYCDYNNYQQIKRQQGIKTSEEVFFSFCDKWDLVPTG